MYYLFVTRGFHGYSVQFSPYQPERLACACAQNYGIAGIGTLFIIDISQGGNVQFFNKLTWQEGLFDCSWSETSPNIISTASGDGSVQLWDIFNQQSKVPLTVFHEHANEVYSVEWSTIRGSNKILSGSWDKTIKLWDPECLKGSISTFLGHQNVIYSSVWSPHMPNTFASGSGDQTIRIWNTGSPEPVHIIPAQCGEVLTCDWSKYDQNILISGSTNNQIRVWDLRNFQQPKYILNGHQYAVKRVKCSPHKPSVLASTSYDMTVRIWDYINGSTPLETIKHHTEFVVGLDFNLHIPSQIADCSWDERINIYSPITLRK